MAPCSPKACVNTVLLASMDKCALPGMTKSSIRWSDPHKLALTCGRWSILTEALEVGDITLHTIGSTHQLKA